MNLRVVGYHSHLMLFFMAGLLAAPFSLAMYEGLLDSSIAYGITIVLVIVLSAVLRYFGDQLTSVKRQDAFGIVAFIWVVLGVVGGLPFYIEGVVSSIPSAIFESVSGFTTTGATVITDIDSISRPANLWRHLSHWVGGMGIIVLFVAIFPHLGVGAKHLFKSETTGPISEGLKPRIRHTALRLWWIYAGLTLLCMSLYSLFGMNWFDAICHAFSTLSTGGFSTKAASIGGFNSSAIEWVTICFMFIGGLNFGLYYAFLHGNAKALYTNYEARLFLGINIAVAVCIMLFLWTDQYSFIDGIRTALFQTVAVTTTTGLMTDNFDRYPDTIRILLFLCMFVGGCAGSTAGGLKVSRIGIVLKSIINEIKKVIRPQAVYSIRLGSKSIGDEVLKNIFSFIAIYFLIFAGSSVILSWQGLDFLSAVSSVVACLSSVGPGLGSVGPLMNYESISTIGKLVLCFCMIAGRLEIFVVLAIFSPLTWRK